MQTKMRYHHTCLRMATTVTLKTASAGMNVEYQEFSFIAGGDEECYSQFRREFASFLQKNLTIVNCAPCY